MPPPPADEGVGRRPARAACARTCDLRRARRARQLEDVLDMLAGRYPSTSSPSCGRGSCGTALDGHGPRPQRRPRAWPSPTPARSPTAGCSAFLPDGRARRRARRGDGLRGARRADLPARRLHVAHRGDHPRPGARHAGAGRARRGAVLARRRLGPARASWARPIGAFARWARRAEPRRAAARHDLDERAARNLLAYLREQQAATGACRATARSSSSASATRSATGACACSRRSAAACTPPGRWRSTARIRDALRPRGGRHLDRRRHRRAPARRRRAARRRARAGRARRGRGARRRRARRAAPCSPRASARTRPARCSSRAPPRPAHAALAAAPSAQPLLAVARRYPPFPIVLETYRECLRDVFDLPGLAELLRGLRTRELALVEVETATASPFASSLLFGYVATYMYEGDAPLAERRAAGPGPRPRAAARAARRGGAARAARPGALGAGRGRAAAPLRRSCARATPTGCTTCCAARRPERRRGRAARAPTAPPPAAWLDALEPSGRRSRVRRRRRGALDRRRGRRPATATRSARCRPPACPSAFLADVPDAAARARCGATPAPTGRSDRRRCGARYGVDAERGSGGARAGRRARARRAPAAAARTRVVRRRRAAAPAPRLARRAAARDRAGRPQALARFRRPGRASTAAGRPAPASTAARRARALQGLALPPELWERDVLPRRLGAYPPARLDELCAARRGRLGRRRRPGGRTAGSRSTSATTRRCSAPPAGATSRARRAAPRAPARAPQPRRLLLHRPPRRHAVLADEEVREALWDLVWAGEVTNDTFAPLRFAGRARPAAAAAPGRAGAGRPRAPLGAGAFGRRPRAHAAAAGALVATRRRCFCRDDDLPAAQQPGVGRAAARAPRHRHPRARARRGHRRRLRRPLPGARRPRDDRRGASRLLRRGARRRPVRAARGDRARPRAGGRRRRPRWCSPSPIPPSLPPAPGRPRGRRSQAGAQGRRLRRALAAAGRSSPSRPAAAPCRRTTAYQAPTGDRTPRPSPRPCARASCDASRSRRWTGRPCSRRAAGRRPARPPGFQRRAGASQTLATAAPPEAAARQCPRATPSTTRRCRVGGALAGRVPDARAPRRTRASAAIGWPQRLAGARSSRPSRPRGKHLLLRFEGGLVIHSHLRMTGAWRVLAARRALAAPSHARLGSCSGAGER